MPEIPKVPTSYEGTAKEEPTIPKVPTSYDATAQEVPPPQPANTSDAEGQ